jgi:CheY-like chemotaxis protein
MRTYAWIWGCENLLQFGGARLKLLVMMRPLAFVCSENMVLGTQLVDRLQELGYRVEILSDANHLSDQTRAARPFVIVSDLVSRGTDLAPMIKGLRHDQATAHIPIIGMTTNPNQQFHADAIAAGASVVAMESGILAQLPQLLDMALAVD